VEDGATVPLFYENRYAGASSRQSNPETTTSITDEDAELSEEAKGSLERELDGSIT